MDLFRSLSSALQNSWSVPLVDKKRARQILDGKDNGYGYLLFDRHGSIEDPIRY